MPCLLELAHMLKVLVLWYLDTTAFESMCSNWHAFVGFLYQKETTEMRAQLAAQK